MTTGGWIVMTLSVGFVTGLFAWCLYRVLSGGQPDHGHAAVEPVDEEQAEAEDRGDPTRR
jgi:hypothetical protein